MWTSSRNSTRLLLFALLIAVGPTPAADNPADRGFLLSLQDPSGCWTSAVPLRSTAAALLALAQPPLAPDRARDLDRAADWLVGRQAPDGRWGEPERPAAAADHALALWALADYQRLRPAPARAAALGRGMGFALRVQQRNGGWAPTLGATARDSRPATGLIIVALVSAREAGATDPKLESALQRAGAQLLGYQDPRTGLLDHPLATWISVAAWRALGRDCDPATRRAVLAGQLTEMKWSQVISEPLLDALLAYRAACGYRPWPADRWDKEVHLSLTSRRQPTGGWAASPAEPQYGAAYATAMSLLLRQAPHRFAPRPAAAATAPLLWRVGPAQADCWLLAGVPLCPEDVLLVPESVSAVLARTRAVYTLLPDQPWPPPGGRALDLRLGAGLFAINQRVVDEGWEMAHTWRRLAHPLALPARALLSERETHAMLEEGLESLLAAGPPPDEAAVIALLEASRSAWAEGREADLADLPLARLPPPLAAAWLRHRQSMIAHLLRRLGDDDARPHSSVIYLPAWYLLGSGGLLEELAWRGVPVQRAEAGVAVDLLSIAGEQLKGRR